MDDRKVPVVMVWTLNGLTPDEAAKYASSVFRSKGLCNFDIIDGYFRVYTYSEYEGVEDEIGSYTSENDARAAFDATVTEYELHNRSVEHGVLMVFVPFGKRVGDPKTIAQWSREKK